MPVVVDQLRAKSPDELRQELTGLRREHFNLRVQKAVQQLNKPSELRRVRREIARALTVLREKEMAEFAQTGKALEFSHAEPAPPPVSSEAEVSPEIAAAAAAPESPVSGVVVKAPPSRADNAGAVADAGTPETKAEETPPAEARAEGEKAPEAEAQTEGTRTGTEKAEAEGMEAKAEAEAKAEGEQGAEREDDKKESAAGSGAESGSAAAAGESKTEQERA